MNTVKVLVAVPLLAPVPSSAVTVIVVSPCIPPVTVRVSAFTLTVAMTGSNELAVSVGWSPSASVTVTATSVVLPPYSSTSSTAAITGAVLV